MIKLTEGEREALIDSSKASLRLRHVKSLIEKELVGFISYGRGFELTQKGKEIRKQLLEEVEG